MSLDPTFLTIHPATAKWFEQREQCLQCSNCDAKTGVNGNTVMRCKLAVVKYTRAENQYCIDARDIGAPCGPEARLFNRKHDK